MIFTKRIIKNTIYILSARIITKVIDIVFTVIAARLLGVADYGIFTLVITYVVMAGFFTNLGLQPMAVRHLARNKSQAPVYLENILSLRLVLATLTYVFLIILVNILHYSPQIKSLIYLAGISLFFGAVTESFDIVYDAHEKMLIPTLFGIFSTITFVTLGIFALYGGYGLKTLISLKVGVDVIVMITCGYYFRSKFFAFRPCIDLNFYLQLFKKTLPYTMLFILVLLDAKIDILMLSKIKGPIKSVLALGYYGPCYSILMPLMIIPNSLRRAMVPMISNKLGTEVNAVRVSVEKTTKFTLIFLSVPIIIATNFFAPQIVSFFFGQQYLPAARALPFLGWAYAFQAVNLPITTVLATSDRLNQYVPWAATMASLNIVLNFWLIPRYSFVGAAIATLASMGFVSLVKYYFIKDVLNIDLVRVKEYLRVLFPVGITVGLMYFLRSSYNPLLILISFIVLYLACIIAFKIINKEELLLLANAVKR